MAGTKKLPKIQKQPAPTIDELRRTLARLTVHKGGRRASSDGPIISVVTPTFNVAGDGGVRFLRTLNSITANAQDDFQIEHLIIDGGSTDGTCALIEQNKEHISGWISAPDKGISDAFNRGAALASGDYIQIVNADDWLSEGQLVACYRTFQNNPDAGFVFGDLNLYTEAGQFLKYNQGRADYAAGGMIRMPHLPHATFCVRREVYEAVGLFDPTVKIAMDLDWVMRAHAAGYHGAYSSEIVGNMVLGGASTTQTWRLLKDNDFIYQTHGVSTWRRGVVMVGGLCRFGLKKVLNTLGMECILNALRKRVSY